MLKELLIFISAGNNETFASFAVEKYSNIHDVFIFYYGDGDVPESWKRENVYVFKGSGLKFNALRELVLNEIIELSNYRYVLVSDDDLILSEGDLLSIPCDMQKFNLLVASPSHHRKGKNSHHIMMRHNGAQSLRLTNFVECGFVFFDSILLKSFITDYDGSALSDGIDWLYLNYIDANNKIVCGVFDSVVAYNPFDSEKKRGSSEIDAYVSKTERTLAFDKLKIKTWQHVNFGYIYKDGFVPQDRYMFQRYIPKVLKAMLRRYYMPFLVRK